MRARRLIGVHTVREEYPTMNLPVPDKQQQRLRILRRWEFREALVRQFKDLPMPTWRRHRAMPNLLMNAAPAPIEMDFCLVQLLHKSLQI
jgi:hypothetical protein